jgi:hypothetical protein
MKIHTKISLFLLALTVSMSVSANTQSSESIFSKKVIHSLIQQSLDSTLDTLVDEFKIPDAPIKAITPMLSNIKSANETIDKNQNTQKRHVKKAQAS